MVNGRAPGRISLGALLFLLVVAAGIYLGMKFIPPYWAYFNLQDPVRDAARTALTQSGEPGARKELIARAKEEGVTLTDDNMSFTQEGPMLVMRVAWVARVELPRYRYNIPFRIEQRVPLR